MKFKVVALLLLVTGCVVDLDDRPVAPTAGNLPPPGLAAQACPPYVPGTRIARGDQFGEYCGILNQSRIADATCEKARASRTYSDADECQYGAESVLRRIRDCVRARGVYADQCVVLQGQAEARLHAAAGDPVWRGEEDRRQQRRGDSARCTARCQKYESGRYYVDYVCVSNCMSEEE